MKENKKTTASIEAQQITTKQLIKILTDKWYNEDTDEMVDPEGIIVNLYTKHEGDTQPQVIGIRMDAHKGLVESQVYYWDSKNTDKDPYEYRDQLITASQAARLLNALQTILPSKWGIDDQTTCDDGYGITKEPDGNKATDEETCQQAEDIHEILRAMAAACQAGINKRKAEIELQKAQRDVENAEETIKDLLK